MHDQPLTRDSTWRRAGSGIRSIFDYCLETDGALACVVTSAERARSGAAARLHPRLRPGLGGPAAGQLRCADSLRGPPWTSRRSCGAADIGPAGVDVAQLYDAFTPLVVLSLEGYGFCARGEAGAFTEGGRIELGGRLPINTSGGGLSEAYVHGFNLILEGVRQVRGTSTCQVDDARVLVGDERRRCAY